MNRDNYTYVHTYTPVFCVFFLLLKATEIGCRQSVWEKVKQKKKKNSSIALFEPKDSDKNLGDAFKTSQNFVHKIHSSIYFLFRKKDHLDICFPTNFF